MTSKDPPPIPNELPLLKNIKIETYHFLAPRSLFLIWCKKGPKVNASHIKCWAWLEEFRPQSKATDELIDDTRCSLEPSDGPV